MGYPVVLVTIEPITFRQNIRNNVEAATPFGRNHTVQPFMVFSEFIRGAKRLGDG